MRMTVQPKDVTVSCHAQIKMGEAYKQGHFSKEIFKLNNYPKQKLKSWLLY